jgi:hypothetical protein
MFLNLFTRCPLSKVTKVTESSTIVVTLARASRVGAASPAYAKSPKGRSPTRTRARALFDFGGSSTSSTLSPSLIRQRTGMRPAAT